MEIHDALSLREQKTDADLFMSAVLGSIDSPEALADCNEAFLIRTRSAEPTKEFINRYIARLANIAPKTPPHFASWARITFFWQYLLKQEAATEKKPLLEAIAAYLDKTSEVPPFNISYPVSTGVRDMVFKPYWPKEAQQYWDSITPKLALTKDHDEILNRIRKTFETASNAKHPELKVIPMTKYWARPKSKALFERFRELQKTYKQLQSVGAWEPTLGSFLEDL